MCVIFFSTMRSIIRLFSTKVLKASEGNHLQLVDKVEQHLIVHLYDTKSGIENFFTPSPLL